MPLYGKLDTADHAAHAPRIDSLVGTADEFAIEKCQILTFTFEIDIEKGFAATPKALHPSIPSYCQIAFRSHPSGPFGPFTIAELRINARASTHYLGYCIGAFTDNAKARQFFAERYGANVREADVRLARMYHGIEGRVTLDGESIFAGLLEKPHYISGSDVLYTPNLNLANVAGMLKLVHQEMEYTLGKAERGKSVLSAFDAAAFGDARVILREPLPATVTEATIRYTGVRYLLDPDKPALTGTETIAA